MGKSPGKWIKTILFGKKTSRSNMSKGRYASKATNDKETWIAAKEPTADLPVVPPSVSEPTPGTTDRNEENSVVQKGTTSSTSHDYGGILPTNQDVDKEEILVSGAPNEEERIKLEQAATKAQAAFRGYLARRAFWVLRGIIRLQALVRGHLVRRQAVATLRCMQGIVKFQALVHGRRLKISDACREVHKNSSLRRPLDAKGLGKLSTSAFVCKLLRSSPSGMPLHLQYGADEPNSAWNWLERWTSSHFWEPIPQTKQVVDLKHQSRQAILQNVETEPSRSRRTARRGPAANVGNGLVHTAPESEKPRRNFRNVSSHPVDPVLENPQNELEKVKCNLRKVSNSMVESTDWLEIETEKPKCSLKNASHTPASDTPDNGTCNSAETMKGDVPVAVAVSKDSDMEITMKSLVSDGPIDVSHDDCPPLELPPSENIGQSKGSIVTDGEVTLKEENNSHDNKKFNRRRASLPAKQETPENGLQNSPKLPSYMLATESAKAKLRAQGSPRFGQDESEKIGSTRRHSLPSSTGAKLSSLSPRMQKPVQASGKGGTKSYKSLLSSRDGNEKVIQADWRR